MSQNFTCSNPILMSTKIAKRKLSRTNLIDPFPSTKIPKKKKTRKTHARFYLRNSKLTLFSVSLIWFFNLFYSWIVSGHFLFFIDWPHTRSKKKPFLSNFPSSEAFWRRCELIGVFNGIQSKSLFERKPLRPENFWFYRTQWLPTCQRFVEKNEFLNDKSSRIGKLIN